jgi:hypothetical protein
LHAYRTWLDEDTRDGSVLTASMEDHFATDIVEFERTHQMWSFLCQKYESNGQSTYLAPIHQEQLLRQSDTTVDRLFYQLSVIWRQLDTLGPQLSPATCQSYRDQTAALELRRTYDFLTRLRDEFEPLRAQLLARCPYVSLMDALAEVRNSDPSPGTNPWYINSCTSFHMTPHSAHLSSLCPYHHCIVHTTNGSPLSIVGQGTLCFDFFMSLIFLLFL